MTADELKRYRKASGLTQREIAAKFGYSLRGWQRAEERGPTPRLALAIKQAEASQ